LTQITGESFVNTSGIASKGDDSVGIELGGVFKSLHFAAEAQKLWVRGTYQPGESVDGDNNAITGTRYNDDPSFFGGYFELGYYLTGESRGYKGGKWDRTKVRKPFDQGGWGAIQLNARIDYLDLTDRVDDSAVVTAPTYVNGGTQLGYQLSLIWNPIDYLRFMAQYGHASIDGGPRAAVVDPANPDPRRNYGVDTAAVRAQIDF
jgi:phosphate-selective porin OprO/OprP